MRVNPIVPIGEAVADEQDPTNGSLSRLGFGIPIGSLGDGSFSHGPTQQRDGAPTQEIRDRNRPPAVALDSIHAQEFTVEGRTWMEAVECSTGDHVAEEVLRLRQ
jgi:hypothetical protein